MTNTPLQFGLTPPSTCSYLPEQQEQLAVLMSPEPLDQQLYQQLIAYNFRRSGDQIYRPHCASCNACQSLRIPVAQFQASKAQRRILNKATRAHWHYQLTASAGTDDEYQSLFKLFNRYIAFKHADGTMYPATTEQLDSLLQSHWQPIRLLKLYQVDQLVAVSIIDELTNSYSAVYTFFAPEAANFSPGKLAVLYLLAAAKASDQQFVYLGYQVDGCRKMAYKTEFRPHQRFFDGYWHSFA
jgi:arginine-tRNA-protein transferase